MIKSSAQSGFAHLLLTVILLAGLAFGVYLVQQKTHLFSKAASGPISGPIPPTIKSYLHRTIYTKDGDYPKSYRCELDVTKALGAELEPSKCGNPSYLLNKTNIEYVSEYVAHAMLYRLSYNKDGLYKEERCSVSQNNRTCLQVRSLNIGTGLQYTSEYVTAYQGDNYLFRLIYYKNGDYKEYRCPLDKNSAMGAKLEPSECTQVRSLNIGTNLQYTSEFITNYIPEYIPGSPPVYAPRLMRLIYQKDGSYSEYRCDLDANNPMGAKLEVNQCQQIRSLNIGTNIQHTSEYISQ